jgi:hypothetical protein
MAIRDRELTTPRCMNKIDYAIQKSKRKGYATMDAFLVKISSNPVA